MTQTQKNIKYPVGIQSFEKLREMGFIYVDKTPYIYPLIKNGGFYFLSRPRRFGKSLLLSTIEAYYLGRRDLFKGLALDSLTEDWEPHPVFHLDLNNREYKDETSLLQEFNANLEQWELIYGDEKKDRAPEERFAYLIRRAFEQTGKKVVILIDEYDKPLLNTIDRPELADVYRSQLKAFYSNLKTMDACIEIAMLTGVARFSKVSIFSDLNNLRDISFVNEFSAICGITSDELDKYFKEGIENIARELQTSYEETLNRLRRNYDGYHFAPQSPDIYNPFSLVYCFANNSIGSYWFESGTPSFLLKVIRREEWNLGNLAPSEITATALESAGIMSRNPIPLLYQTGYLTIKDFDPMFRTYTLDYPNEEVKQGFMEFLVPYYIHPESRPSVFSIKQFVLEVMRGDAEGFMKRLESMIAGVPYSEKGSTEAHFQNAIYILFQLMGYYTRMEERTSDGRIDLKVETDRYIYIFEFKIDSTSRAAIEQIEEKRYWLPDAVSDKEIILIGANFDTATRRLDTPIIRRLQK
ncbi:MAG: ATP-binding protein [Muribaculaceae bacterium]|nr:ATP-binding protein [Muribaculaceae bacterium]